MEGRAVLRETFLSPNVHHLVCAVGCRNNEVPNSHPMLDAKGLIHWNHLHKLLFENYDGSWSEEFSFSDHVGRLAPVAKAVLDQVIQQNQTEVVAKYCKLWSWTSDAETLTRCFESLLSVSSSSSCTETSLLLTTAILERSLGNVFLMKNSNCPSLLKDLLVTEELKKIFGEGALFCLRILLGPPTSLNLRNLLWHGFAQPSEISKRYAVFLLVLIASLGDILQEQGMMTELLKCQRDFIDITKHASLVETHFTGTDDFVHESRSLLLESGIFPQKMVVFLTDALECFRQKRFSWSAAIILPLLECTLRLIYAEVNGCPERVLTAESSTLFTTFDEILSSTLFDGSENKLPVLVGDGIMEMLLDLLVYPDGPRLRDRLSHGELSFHSIPSSLVSFIIAILISLSAKLSSLKEAPESGVLQDVLAFCESYRSIFHPFSYFIRDYVDICERLGSWKSLPKPSDEDLGHEKSLQNETKEFKVIQNCRNVVIKISGAVTTDSTQRADILRFMEPFSDAAFIIPSCQATQIKTLFRPKSEQQLVTILHQIVHQCSTVNCNIQTIGATRFDQWKTRQLRSRQRVNYIRFLQSIPCLSCGLRMVMVILLIYVKRINSWIDDSERGSSAAAVHIKFLKKVLQYSENISALTEKNKWDETVSLTEKFTDLVGKFSGFQEYTSAE